MAGDSGRSWLRPLVRPLLPLFRELIALSLFINLLALAVPVFVLQVYDRVVFHAGLSTLQGLVIGMLVVIGFDFVLRQTRARLMQRVALKLDVEVGRKLFEKLQAIPLRLLESRPAAYWQSLFRDVESVRNMLSGGAAVLLADLPFIVLFVGLVYVIAAPIAWVLLVALPVFVLIALRSGGTLSRANRRERESGLSRDTLIAELVAGRTTVKALALDDAVRPRWETRQAEVVERGIERGGKADSYANLGVEAALLTTVLLTAVGAVAILQQQLTIGALIAANILTNRMLGPCNQLVAHWRTFASFRQAAQRLGEVFAAPEERRQSKLALERPKGGIELDNVSFRYGEDGPPALEGIRLRVNPGGLHAIVGPNGSGKTTLLKVIQGLYPASAGRVLLDGADVGQFTRRELARWIGYVPQDGVLFAGTIRDNIAMARPAAEDADILRAATTAGLHDYVIDLPDGYATEIGEAGGRLSRGLQQRVAIARALLGDPPVLLLDEPTASLDREAEEALRAALTRLAGDHTVLMVTHSPILLAACHNVLALDRGRIALAGPGHEVLPKLFGGPSRKPPLERKA